MVARNAVSVILLGLAALAMAACGSSTPRASSSSTRSSSGNKAAFCKANIALDKAGQSVMSMDGFLAVLKAHAADVSTVKNDGPPAIRPQAQALVAAEEKAVADNNASELAATGNNGGAVDTFCGVDGSGNPLPSYFGAGKAMAFCSVNAQINQGTSTAPDAAGVLAFLKAHQDLMDSFANDLSSLPAKQKAEAQQLVTIARTAVSSGNAAPLGSSTVQANSTDLSLYCGQNQ